VLLSEQLARRLKLALGDTLTLPAADGEQRLPVLGLYADYGNPKGHLLVSASWLRRHWPDARLSDISLQLPAARVGPLKAELEQRYALDGTRLIDQSSLKRWSTRVFERTFAATAALNSLTLGVAGVALFISLLTLGQSRLGQLAPLWALGLGRQKLAWLSLAQTLLLACLTVLLAMPLGLLLAWCLVAVVNVQAFGWRLPLHVFPAQLLQLGLLGLLTSLLAAAGPLWQLARRQPADLLRQFADER
jgi:putative ABC transport system permease protein